jgi:hypothetical protein
MSRRYGIAVCAVVAAFLLSACEKQQTMTGNTKKAETPVWQAGDSRWVRADAKAGDKASWERQMAARAQYQNDYSRAGQ